MKQQTKEIVWNIVNSVLAGLLVLFGAFSTGNITPQGFCAALSASGIVALTKFYDYWKTEQSEYSRVFSFVN